MRVDDVAETAEVKVYNGITTIQFKCLTRSTLLERIQIISAKSFIKLKPILGKKTKKSTFYLESGFNVFSQYAGKLYGYSLSNRLTSFLIEVRPCPRTK